MKKIIKRYDDILESVFDQKDTEHQFNIEKDLQKLIKQYEILVKPAFIYVINMRDSESRLVYEKNYNLESDQGEVTFERIMSSVHEKEFELVMEIDSISAQFINNLFEEPFQFLMNVAMPVELIKGKPEYFLRTATVMSFAKDGTADYAIAYFKNVTKVTGIKNGVKYYISSNEKRSPKVDELAQAFNKLLESKLLLTHQEKNILINVKSGKTSTDIAKDLFISKSTVDTHRQNIIKKLQVKNMLEAIEKAVNIGVID